MNPSPEEILKRIGYNNDSITSTEKFVAEEAYKLAVKDLTLPQCGTYSSEFLTFIKQAELPPLTNTQHYFAEWLIRNKDMIMQIGDLEIIFRKIRKWLK
jgi:hypothetical protein